jgi:dTDP-4-dehydrorhamnose 3,5-epimerase-like enzyme
MKIAPASPLEVLLPEVLLVEPTIVVVDVAVDVRRGSPTVERWI